MAESDDTGSAKAADELPSLEAFLVECQKCLGRVATMSSEASKTDSNFARGERPLYAIDGVTFKLKAGIQLKTSTSGSPRIHLDFDSSPETRSELEFRVESRPVEVVAGAKLEVANLDPLGEEFPLVKLRVWLVNDRGQPESRYPVQVHFSRSGDTARSKKQKVNIVTDEMGRCDLFLETDKNELKVVGDRKRKPIFVRGSGRGHGTDEFFVWATCEPKKDWKLIAEPSMLKAPQREKSPATQHQPKEILYSERIRVRMPGKKPK